MNESRKMQRSLRLVALAGAVLVATAPSLAEDLRNVVGSTHAAGKYNFTHQDYLNEGADRLLDLGTQVIKVWFTLNPAASYPFNSNWTPNPTTYLALAQKSYYQELFAKPFSTFILVVGGEPVATFLDNLTPTELNTERVQMHDLALHLLTTYAGTGKTFVIQNWEGDHLLQAGIGPGFRPPQSRIQRLTAWWEARQDGITAAREEARARGVEVYGADEANSLSDAMIGKVTVTNNVLPLTHADLYSYSSWDVGFDPDRLTAALDYLEAHAPASATCGRQNIYLGEFGAVKDQLPEGSDRAAVIRHLAETAVSWGVRYAAYWQLFDNEEAVAVTGRPDDDDMRGFWLVPPDGTQSPMWFDFGKMVDGSVQRLSLKTHDGKALTAVAHGGGLVMSPASMPAWQTFAARRDERGSLVSGDPIFLRAHNGMIVSTATGAAGSVVTSGWDGEPSQNLIVKKASGGGSLDGGDRVTVQDAAGRYWTLTPSGAVVAQSVPSKQATVFIVTLLP